MDIKRIPPVGDPFTAAPHYDEHDERPHACTDGIVFIGRLVVGDDGEEVEVFDAVPCRRCAEEAR